MLHNLVQRGNKQPLHVQVATVLRSKILDGVWRTGDSIPPEKALCAEFKVARGTLRQALQTLEAEGYLRREQGRGTFIATPALSATRAARPDRGRVAFLLPHVRDAALLTTLNAFEQTMQAANISIVVRYIGSRSDKQDQFLKELLNSDLKGIVLYPVNSDYNPSVQQLAERFPVVLIDRYIKQLTTDYVMSDCFGGVIQGVRYLHEQGHTRIGYVTWCSASISMEHRLLGFRQGLAEHNIDADESLICKVDPYPTINIQPIIDYLRPDTRPTALFAANDHIAVCIYRAAALLGLSIPQDLSVLGFDNLEISPHLDPPLTTVAQPYEAIGITAAEILLKRMNGQGGCDQIMLPTELIRRESCQRQQEVLPV
jgi:DNA-binding LacI/PurR family transcriptional regulator